MRRFVAVLENHLPGSFNDILKQQGASEQPLRKQVQALNSALQPIIDSLSLANPSLTFGYYSIEQDSTVAVWPFDNSLLQKQPRDKPYFKVYETGEPVYYNIASAALKGANVLGWANPIVKDGKIVGHAWASIKVGDVYREARKQGSFIALFGLLMLVGAIYISHRIYVRFKRELEHFASSFVKNNLTPEIVPEIRPIVHQVQEYVARLKFANDQLQSVILERNKAAKALDHFFEAGDYPRLAAG